MHLADAFIQIDLQYIQVINFCQYVCSLGIEPTTFALLTQCSTTEPQKQRNTGSKCGNIGTHYTQNCTLMPQLENVANPSLWEPYHAMMSDGRLWHQTIKIKGSRVLFIFSGEERVQSHGSLLVLLVVYIISNDTNLHQASLKSKDPLDTSHIIL